MILITITKLAWSVFLACLAGHHFKTAFEKEHTLTEGTTLTGKPMTKDTYVWANPTSFLWLILVISIIFMVKFGAENGLSITMNIVLNLTAFFCIYFAVLMPLMPYLHNKISSRACATLWFCPIFMFYGLTFVGDDSYIGLFSIYIPRRVLLTIVIVWLTGFVITYTYSLISHIIFKRRIMAEASPITDRATLDIWENVRAELEFLRPTALLVSPGISSPLSMGRMKKTRCTILPAKDYSKDELRMIFLHEAHHLQRWDVDTKVFLTAVKCACWFNPMVWIAAKTASQDLELSCDEIVAEQMSDDEKKSYAQLLLQSASEQNGFTTCLSASAGALKYRLKNVVRSRCLKLGRFAVAVAVFISIMCYNLVSIADSRGTLRSYISSEDFEITYSLYHGTTTKTTPEEAEQFARLLDETVVEHYLNSANIVIYEDPVCTLRLNGPTGWNGTREITFYEHYVTVSDGMHLGTQKHTITYKIL